MVKTAAQRAREYRARKAAARVNADTRLCPVCGEPMAGQRADAKVCSTTCRMRGHRHLQSLQSLALDPRLDRYKGGISLKSRQGLHDMMTMFPEQFAGFMSSTSR